MTVMPENGRRSNGYEHPEPLGEPDPEVVDATTQILTRLVEERLEAQLSPLADDIAKRKVAELRQRLGEQQSQPQEESGAATSAETGSSKAAPGLQAMIEPGHTIYFPFASEYAAELPLSDKQGRIVPGVSLQLIPCIQPETEGQPNRALEPVFVSNPFLARTSNWRLVEEAFGKPTSPTQLENSGINLAQLTPMRHMLTASSDAATGEFPAFFAYERGDQNPAIVTLTFDAEIGGYTCQSVERHPAKLLVAQLAVRDNVLVVHVPEPTAEPSDFEALFQGLVIQSPNQPIPNDLLPPEVRNWQVASPPESRYPAPTGPAFQETNPHEDDLALESSSLESLGVT